MKKKKISRPEASGRSENRKITKAAVTANADAVAANDAACKAADAAVVTADDAAETAADAAVTADAAIVTAGVATATADAAVVTADEAAITADAAADAVVAADIVVAAISDATASAAVAANAAATAAAEAVTDVNTALAESETKRSHQEQLARTDRLTGLSNLSGFFDDLDRHLKLLTRYKHPASLAIIDIDDFKEVNDTFGHLAGNKLLKILGLTIRRTIRSSDLAGRIGGDEFAILFPEIEPEKAKVAVDKFVAALYEVATDEFPNVTYSVGIAGYHTVPNTYKDMVREADRVMYEVKNAGKNAVKLEILS
jgi:diguanylate cyclase (GGDEF)-like protein